MLILGFMRILMMKILICLKDIVWEGKKNDGSNPVLL